MKTATLACAGIVALVVFLSALSLSVYNLYVNPKTYFDFSATLYAPHSYYEYVEVPVYILVVYVEPVDKTLYNCQVEMHFKNTTGSWVGGSNGVGESWNFWDNREWVYPLYAFEPEPSVSGPYTDIHQISNIRVSVYGFAKP